ncbi:hypothetical protein PSTG_11083 [Puccinia striiformis f. sp. tritici PST-78]|uniref:Uncharacterized protein n=1 Tax=Puccinia striiformis f. sp. tritici PST-78 TaxID=1165861 RepID=A0A0L0V8I1_9BASI|nr:hypothetical protein PSTG_11083 [Puccinia striiformis f. sp. tritici PST-78]
MPIQTQVSPTGKGTSHGFCSNLAPVPVLDTRRRGTWLILAGTTGTLTAWSFSSLSGGYLDGLELLQLVRRLYQQLGASPACQEAISTAWRSSSLSGDYPNGLEKLHLVRRPP